MSGTCIWFQQVLRKSRAFGIYYFAHSKLNYACMILFYLADMASLKHCDANIYREFLDGKVWVVNTNLWVRFCVIGADHALEHPNRSIKVAGAVLPDVTGTS